MHDDLKSHVTDKHTICYKMLKAMSSIGVPKFDTAPSSLPKL